MAENVQLLKDGQSHGLVIARAKLIQVSKPVNFEQSATRPCLSVTASWDTDSDVIIGAPSATSLWDVVSRNDVIMGHRQ